MAVIDQDSFNAFYPVSATIQACPLGPWQIGMAAKLADHLAAAKAGDRDRESRLVNRLGQIHRHLSTGQLTGVLADQFKEACQWLQSVGRKIDFRNENPACWISQRGGAPRW